MDMFADRTGGGNSEVGGRATATAFLSSHQLRLARPTSFPLFPSAPLVFSTFAFQLLRGVRRWSWAALVLAHHPAATADDRARAAASRHRLKKSRPPEKAASASPAAPRSPCLMPARREKPAAKGRPDTRVDPMAPAYRTEDDKLHTLSPPRRRRK